MYDKLKNIQITNEHEPRIKFITESFINADGVSAKEITEYDICLSLIPFDSSTVDSCQNMEELLSAVLKQVVEYKELVER